MNRQIELTILQEDSGKKLHRYLRQTLPRMPLSGVYKMIRVGRVKVNGKKGKMDALLSAGDQLTLYLAEADYESLKKSKPKFSGVPVALDIVYEDKTMMVVNKPSGLLTHPDAKEQKDTLVNRVLAYLYQKGELSADRTFMPAPVNRLDRNTSGIVVFGKDLQTLRDLTEAIRERKVRKTYLGLVWGDWIGKGDINASLKKEYASSGTAVVKLTDDPSAQSAHTRYRVLGSLNGYSLVELELVSGRTHQLRAHLQSVGHPLVGDLKYGGREGLGVTHQLLHAYTLKLPDGEEWVASPPKDFMEALNRSTLSGYLPLR